METPIKNLRNRILEVALRDGMGHIPSALSILDIVWHLHDKVMTKDDQFVLSKGHGVMALYAVLEAKGKLRWDTRLMGHPLRGGPILASTGSLGHGFPIAVGLAKAKKIRKEPGRVFVLIGDGECNEGTVWESAMLAAHHELDNLFVIVDFNGSSERALSLGNLENKFRAFGFESRTAHGHSPIAFLKYGYGYPQAIIAETTKGNGVPFMENDPSWHNRKITTEDHARAIS